MNYVFYDFETTGLDTKFSQPIQIAAVCLDENFKELDRIDQKCKLNDGIIPHPSAMLVTKVSIDDLKNKQSFYNVLCLSNVPPHPKVSSSGCGATHRMFFISK